MALNRGAIELKRWRAETGTTQRAISVALDIDQTTVCHYEAGRRRPRLEQAAAIEKITGIDATSWIEDVDQGATA